MSAIPAAASPAGLGEARALRLSAGASLLLCALGIAWGLAAQSQVILFDGLYAIIGFVLAWLGLRASKLVDAGPTPSFPFGREALAPVMVAAQGLTLLGTFGYAVLDAIGVILEGGGRTELGWAFAYSIVNLAACVGMRAVLIRGQAGSDLVAAEVVAWGAAAVLGIAMVLGFGIALLLGVTPLAWAAPFVDPVLVLVAAALILPTPIRMLRDSFRELLEGAPSAEVTDPVHASLAAIRSELGLPEPTTRIAKLGRKVYVELDFLVGADEGWSIADADRIRRRLVADLQRPGRVLWVNVELHVDPDWDV